MRNGKGGKPYIQEFQRGVVDCTAAHPALTPGVVGNGRGLWGLPERGKPGGKLVSEPIV